MSHCLQFTLNLPSTDSHVSDNSVGETIGLTRHIVGRIIRDEHLILFMSSSAGKGMYNPQEFYPVAQGESDRVAYIGVGYEFDSAHPNFNRAFECHIQEE